MHGYQPQQPLPIKIRRELPSPTSQERGTALKVTLKLSQEAQMARSKKKGVIFFSLGIQLPGGRAVGGEGQLGAGRKLSGAEQVSPEASGHSEASTGHVTGLGSAELPPLLLQLWESTDRVRNPGPCPCPSVPVTVARRLISLDLTRLTCKVKMLFLPSEMVVEDKHGNAQPRPGLRGSF